MSDLCPQEFPDPARCLPHGPGFRFVSRLLLWEPGTLARGLWELRGDEPFFADHFPDHPVVPAVLLAEALAQLTGLAALESLKPDQAPRSGAIASLDLRFPHPAIPPGEIELESHPTRRIGPLVFAEVKARQGHNVCAKGILSLALS